MVAYSFKKEFIKPIQAGLEILPVVDGYPAEVTIEDGIARPFDSTKDLDPPVRPKRQTIRANGKRRHAREGENLQLYYGMRTKQCRSIGVARCSKVTPIVMRIPKDDAFLLISIDGAPEVEVTDEFAARDGFGSVEDMWLFWRREHADVAVFEGVLIEWEPIR